ncbi:DEAD/DEAH box helicase [Rothia sp. ARF10]|nr:DEAD/DEAH box helicase [Rothia sp. ARF10]
METAQGFDRLHPVVQHHIVNSLGWPALRKLQEQSIDPVMSGHDALLLAPTAGGKTEAAMFPILSRMEAEQWRGLSVLYVCPLKALLNNLQPRLETYAGWLGREAQVRHGDTSAGARKRQLLQRPDVLLTTPESLEAMLVSTLVDAPRLFGDLRAVVVDELHAFAGDDRGWHLLAVLERLTELTGRPLQRIGLSATVGNAEELLSWFQGAANRSLPRAVVAPAVEGPVEPALSLDYVGNVGNAAKVVAGIHVGEKRLVFADSRRTVESMAARLRELHVDTFVSHSSLSIDERRRAEQAFAEAPGCVIVSTSTLELGIDVGDLDRVVQVGAPSTVASVLQRLGRTGRRAGTSRNLTFLATDDEELLRAAGLLLLLGEGFVEPVQAPPEPRHVAAQQILGLALERGRIDLTELSWLVDLGLTDGTDKDDIVQWLCDTGHLDTDEGLHFIGPEAERRYGAKNFLELLAVFTAAPEVTVLHGRQEVGSVDPMLLMSKVTGPRIIALAGRPWEVTHMDWKRRRAFVEPSDQRGRSRWSGDARAYSFELSDAIRRLLLGSDPVGVDLSDRAHTRLETLREEWSSRVSADSTLLVHDGTRLRWWTFAGARANTVLSAVLAVVSPTLVEDSAVTNMAVSLRSDATPASISSAMVEARVQFGEGLEGLVPEVSESALRKLKFAELLPPRLARETLGVRNVDRRSAVAVASARVEQKL